MKKILSIIAVALPLLLSAGNNPVVSSAIVPQFMEGSTTSTNNNRVEIWFWVNLSGLNANGTYHYFTAMDSLAPVTVNNGAGLPILLNETTRTIRRILNPSMTSNTGYDSLTADASGNYSGWFGVEPTGNARFTAGNMICPKIMLNNGLGGTTVAYRLLMSTYPVKTISFGTTASSTTQGSALFDSLNAAPKNFIGIYDNIGATGRPVNIAIVEDDTLYLRQFPSTAMFYRNRVDSLPFHWGAIIPNDLPNGVRALVEMDFTSGAGIDTTIDDDGIWCFGTNTVNMSSGNTGLFLNSTFVLSGTYVIPDTTWTGFPTAFSANYHTPNATYSWNYGDLGTGTGAMTSHTYTAPGIYNAELIVSTGGCSDTINQTVVVMLTTGISHTMPLSMFISPNPTNGEIIITTKDMNEKTVSIINVLGEELDSEVLTGNSMRIEMGSYPKGIYLVRVKDNVTGRIGTKRIVLQ